MNRPLESLCNIFSVSQLVGHLAALELELLLAEVIASWVSIDELQAIDVSVIRSICSPGPSCVLCAPKDGQRDTDKGCAGDLEGFAAQVHLMQKELMLPG